VGLICSEKEGRFDSEAAVEDGLDDLWKVWGSSLRGMLGFLVGITE